ncbi:hypothetical protein P4056_23015 [Pseudomonas aeruginosa]|nr:hypothetical protein [Pseudomonas aeruginosa]
MLDADGSTVLLDIYQAFRTEEAQAAIARTG